MKCKHCRSYLCFVVCHKYLLGDVDILKVSGIRFLQKLLQRRMNFLDYFQFGLVFTQVLHWFYQFCFCLDGHLPSAFRDSWIGL